MRKVRYIGDIHGYIFPYLRLTDTVDFPTVQIGDFGFGFINYNPIGPDDYRNRFIRGNHDSPAVCKEQHNWIADGTIEDNVGFIGGASSIDRAYRTEGVSWWPDEQCSIAELLGIHDKFTSEKPEVIISHECPEFIANAICQQYGKSKFPDDNRTRIMLEQVYYSYKPKLHIFGHWHLNFDYLYQGTRFICLPELSYIDIDLDNLYQETAVKNYYKDIDPR